MEEEQLPEIGKPETFPYDQWDDTVQYWRLGDPPIQRPEKAWHPLVYAGVHSPVEQE